MSTPRDDFQVYPKECMGARGVTVEDAMFFAGLGFFAGLLFIAVVVQCMRCFEMVDTLDLEEGEDAGSSYA